MNFDSDIDREVRKLINYWQYRDEDPKYRLSIAMSGEPEFANASMMERSILAWIKNRVTPEQWNNMEQIFNEALGFGKDKNQEAMQEYTLMSTGQTKTEVKERRSPDDLYKNVPPHISSRVCQEVAKAWGADIPFTLGGITINLDLIEAALAVLNGGPQKNLTQNCRNDIRSRMSDGVDGRTKEYLYFDTRTTDIISDVLAEAGVVEIVEVVNPRTGRRIKGTRLLDEWSWRKAAEKNHAAVIIPKSHRREVRDPGKQPVKSLGLDGLSRAEYLNDSVVKDFIRWLEGLIDEPGLFKHQYYLVKAKRAWKCDSLYEAYERYWWPYNLYCPLQGKQVSGIGFNDSFKYMNLLAEAFRNSVQRQDTQLIRKCTSAMLAWGGVLNRNQDRIANLGEQVGDYFKRAKENLNLSDTRLGNHDDIFINSGFTKLYSLLINDFIMYDGRVGAALGLLGRLYSQEKTYAKIPDTIEFSFGSGKVSSAKQLDDNRRDPSTNNYRLPEFSGNQTRHMNDNIKASWLLKELADKTRSRFTSLPQDALLNERLTAIQSALFMIGYDVLNKRDQSGIIL